MLVELLKSKIHRARVTDHNLHYEGSLTLDRRLMDAAGLLPYERISVYNVSNGNRFDTYVIEGEAGGGTVCVNGAAAHLAKKGDIVIVVAFALIEDDSTHRHTPRLVHVDEHNEPLETEGETP